MTKKKIRYSEFPAPATPATPPVPAPSAADEAPVRARRARRAAAPVAEAPAVPESVPDASPASAPEPVESRRPKAPLDLARALADARSAEAAAVAALRPAAPSGNGNGNGSAHPGPNGNGGGEHGAREAAREVVGRLTPMRGNAVISRPTPVRGSVAIPRLTPARGSVTIVPDAPVAAPAAAASMLRERARQRTGTVDLLVFAVGREWFGLELAAVEEAIDLPAVRHVPEMPPAMLGVVTVRGMLTSLFSPASALGVSLNDGASALVFRRARGRLAIAVDDVDDVHSLDLAQLRETPVTDGGDGIVLGVLRYRDALLALVDAEALIAACQTVPVLETA